MTTITVGNGDELGAEPVTPERSKLIPSSIEDKKDLFILTVPEGVGERLVRNFDIQYSVVGSLSGKATSAEDTKRIAKEMLNEDVDLVVFVGGDGTSRDIYDLIGDSHSARDVVFSETYSESIYIPGPKGLFPNYIQ